MSKPLTRRATLRRLERAAMRFYHHTVNPNTYAINPKISRAFFDACAANAKATAKHKARRARHG